MGGRAPKQAPQRGDTARFLRRAEEAATGRAALVAALDALLAVQRSAPWHKVSLAEQLGGLDLLKGAWPGLQGCCRVSCCPGAAALMRVHRDAGQWRPFVTQGLWRAAPMRAAERRSRWPATRAVAPATV